MTCSKTISGDLSELFEIYPDRNRNPDIYPDKNRDYLDIRKNKINYSGSTGWTRIRIESLGRNYRNYLRKKESLQLQKCGDYLENFEYGEEYEESRPLLLELIIKYCTKFKRFILDKPDKFNVYLLIENIGQTINYISIDLDDQDLSQIILQNLGRVLPSKLEYLHLELLFNTDDFKMFLIDFQNTFVKKFLISDTTQDLYHEGILFYTKEYMMKKKRVKYLAIKGRCELVDLKNEVKEFRLYDIIVEKYFDLYINYLQFTK
ncbi:hypothetical protein C1646_796378 [Rhizophagus diaphanus]|nr:hypothetical protein C1646_796378 [Rhizophagus diaphanus] [Rhizophagus sp. MUCL 43196]